jgi:hypothetical protein
MKNPTILAELKMSRPLTRRRLAGSVLLSARDHLADLLNIEADPARIDVAMRQHRKALVDEVARHRGLKRRSPKCDRALTEICGYK